MSSVAHRGTAMAESSSKRWPTRWSGCGAATTLSNRPPNYVLKVQSRNDERVLIASFDLQRHWLARTHELFLRSPCRPALQRRSRSRNQISVRLQQVVASHEMPLRGADSQIFKPRPSPPSKMFAQSLWLRELRRIPLSLTNVASATRDSTSSSTLSRSCRLVERIDQLVDLALDPRDGGIVACRG